MWMVLKYIRLKKLYWSRTSNNKLCGTSMIDIISICRLT